MNWTVFYIVGLFVVWIVSAAISIHSNELIDSLDGLGIFTCVTLSFLGAMIWPIVVAGTLVAVIATCAAGVFYRRQKRKER